MLSINEYNSIDRCECCRSYCKYYSGLVGDRGESYSDDDIKEMISDINAFVANHKDTIEHLESLLTYE